MPVFVEPTLTELQINSVLASASGIERINSSSLFVMPFDTIAKTLDRAAHTVGVNFIGGYSAIVT